jgi:hypothetical protein
MHFSEQFRKLGALDMIVADISRNDIRRKGNEAGCFRILFTGFHGAIFYEGGLPARR